MKVNEIRLNLNTADDEKLKISLAKPGDGFDSKFMKSNSITLQTIKEIEDRHVIGGFFSVNEFFDDLEE